MFQKTLGEVAMHAHQKRSNHDPRKDPQAGDITAYSSDDLTSIYRVAKRDGRVVYYTQTTNGKTSEHDTFVEDWIDGSENDEVLHVATAEAREAGDKTVTPDWSDAMAYAISGRVSPGVLTINDGTPTAAEVVEACRVALGSLHKAAMDLRCATAIPSVMRAVEWHAAQETVVAELVVAEKALALIARYKEANGE